MGNDVPSDNSYRIPGPLIVLVMGSLLTGAISFNAWAVAAVYARPTEERVTEMIEDKSQFTRDRSMILQALNDLKTANIEVRKALEKTTDELSQLKILLKAK